MEHIEHFTLSNDPAIRQMICGFDLINEEDICPPISKFAPEIIDAK